MDLGVPHTGGGGSWAKFGFNVIRGRVSERAFEFAA